MSQSSRYFANPPVSHQNSHANEARALVGQLWSLFYYWKILFVRKIYLWSLHSFKKNLQRRFNADGQLFLESLVCKTLVVCSGNPEGESINEKSSAKMLNDFRSLHLVFWSSVSQWEGEKSAQSEECTHLPTLLDLAFLQKAWKRCVLLFFILCAPKIWPNF